MTFKCKTVTISPKKDQLGLSIQLGNTSLDFFYSRDKKSLIFPLNMMKKVWSREGHGSLAPLRSVSIPLSFIISKRLSASGPGTVQLDNTFPAVPAVTT